MIPLFFLLLLVGGGLLLILLGIGKIFWKTYLIKKLKQQKEKNRRLEEILRPKMLPLEEDVLDESEETNEARGLPSSAVMDEEDEEDEE